MKTEVLETTGDLTRAAIRNGRCQGRREAFLEAAAFHHRAAHEAQHGAVESAHRDSAAHFRALAVDESNADG